MIPPFVLPTRHPPSPDASRNPGLVDVVHRDRGDLELPVRQLAVAAGWRDASQLLFALVAYLLAAVLASPGRRPFLPGPLSPPYPTSHSPAMV